MPQPPGLTNIHFHTFKLKLYTMKSNNTTKQNMKAVNHFLEVYGEGTAKEMSKFLFMLQGIFLTQSDMDYIIEYQKENLVHFEMLYNLVNELQPVKTIKL